MTTTYHIKRNHEPEGSVVGTDEQPIEMNDCDRPAALAAAQLDDSDKLGGLEESLNFPPFTRYATKSFLAT